MNKRVQRNCCYVYLVKVLFFRKPQMVCIGRKIVSIMKRFKFL